MKSLKSSNYGKVMTTPDFRVAGLNADHTVHTATQQAMQNQNKLTVHCTGTSYKASSSNNNFA